MEEFYRRFEKLARKHFPKHEFKTWEELTEEDKAGLEDIYTRLIVLQEEEY